MYALVCTKNLHAKTKQKQYVTNDKLPGAGPVF